MLRMRRTLAFACRVHNYLLLLYLFSVALYFTQLWWDTTELYTTVVTTATAALALVGILYGALILLFSLILSLIDRIFPLKDFFMSVGRIALFILLFGITLFLRTITESTLTIFL